MQHLLRKQIITGIITGSLLLCISFASVAQRGEVYQPFSDEQRFYRGMSIGLNNSYLNFNRNIDFIFPNSSAVNIINPKNNMALNLGLIIGTLRLSKHTLLRLNPTVLIAGSKNLYTFTKKNNPSDTLIMNAFSAIMNIPLALKIESDRYNAFHFTDLMRHYVFLGGKIDFDILRSNKSNIYTKSKSGNNLLINNTLYGLDYGYEMGLGVSFYLRYATISPEVKFSYGVRNLNKGDALLSSIRDITGNFVYFTVHIEN